MKAKDLIMLVQLNRAKARGVKYVVYDDNASGFPISINTAIAEIEACSAEAIGDGVWHPCDAAGRIDFNYVSDCRDNQ